MFEKSADFYDAIYYAKGKDYEAEVRHLLQIIDRHAATAPRTMLELACGTGNHTVFLRQHFQVEGLDLDAGMLAIARDRYPGVPFHLADMRSFSLAKTFDVVICLFSAIGYAHTLEQLHGAIRTMADHVSPGGLLLVEPWISPEEYRPGGVFSVFVDKPDLKIARMNVNEVRGNVSVINFHYMVATPTGVQHFTEEHELGLYSRDQYLSAFESAGLGTEWESDGLIGRGMYVGRKG